MKDLNKKYPWLAYVSAVVIFLAVSMIYFAPQFRGEVLDMHDVTQYVASSGDIEHHYKTYGEDPQWTGSTFSGMPSYMINFKVHALLIRKLSKLPVKVLGEPAILIFAAMLCFWLMTLLWGVNPWVGIIPSLAYGFSTYTILIIGAGHISKVWAIAYIPLLIGAIVYTYRSRDTKKMWFGGALAAFAASLEISANHPQITYYFLLVILALIINEFIKSYKGKALKRFWKASGILAIAAVLGVASNVGTLYYTAAHTSDTTRGGSELAGQTDKAEQKGLDLEYATAWSYGIAESFNMFIPNFMGGASDKGFKPDGKVAEALRGYNVRSSDIRPAYWGDQPMTAGPTYIGATVIFLAVLGMFLLPGRRKWWLLAVSVLALFMSWGSNMMWFTELLFKILPGYNKFRAVSTALVIVQWTMPVLVMLVLSQIWNGEVPKDKLKKGLKWATIITGAVALFFAALGPKLFSFTSPMDAYYPAGIADAMRMDRMSMMRTDSWRSLLFVVVSGGIVMLFLRGKIKKGMMVAILAGLICVDLIQVDTRFLSYKDFVTKRQTEIRPTQADRLILEDKDLGYRVADLTTSTFSDARASYFHRSVGGYHGAKLQRYQDLIDHHLGNMNMEAYNMLNTRYFIIPDSETGVPTAQLNPDANGAAWIVDEIVFVDGPDAEIAALNGADTKNVAIVDKRFEEMLHGAMSDNGSAYINLKDYKVNHLTYESVAKEECVAVFSEIYYDKGWTAYIDGQPAEYFRTDYVLRGMVLPKGVHTVEFKFRAPHFALMSGITLTCSLLILLWLAGTGVWLIIDWRRKKKTE